MTNKMIESSKLMLDELDRVEELRVKTIDEKNTLETLIYAKNEWVDSEQAKKVSLLNKFKSLSTQLKKKLKTEEKL